MHRIKDPHLEQKNGFRKVTIQMERITFIY